MKALLVPVTLMALCMVVETYDSIDPSLVPYYDRVPSPHALTPNCWTGNVVPYMFKEDFAFPFSDEQLEVVKKSIDTFNSFTCLKWVDVDETPVVTKEYVIFNKSVEGWCRMARLNNLTSGTEYIVITLHPSCMRDKVEHMMMHALGFTHEHQRSDRDCFVDVHPSQVEVQNYNIVPQPRWEERYPYDKYSVLHYSANWRLKSWINVTVGVRSWKKEFREPFGNEFGRLSKMDLSKIRYKFCKGVHFCDANPIICGRAQDYKYRKNCTFWRFTNPAQVLPPE